SLFQMYVRSLHQLTNNTNNESNLAVKNLVFLCCVAVMLFQEVWGKSFCRTIENLVEVVQEYPGEVEHIFSPACVPLVRCAGCCGDENLECHPTLTSNTTMQVRIFPLTRPTIFTVSKVGTYNYEY
uniref:Placental growth factor b n=1 Tax=Sinocyclocheilus grahami TaxID=75366 RepID=A0A672N7T7_SINGR